ncbi:TetR/AcrR family transcriptional regulator [Rhodococcoides yunnanense]|uniref:TetR/AcrR family transcriptional regulator n=1 Tax=Rhodococcoides yunnanense TaxID=278209 RepID=UPI000A0511D3|nr:TetR/AcrR family transcriptional regulator [Rhodococcus yunnanensis]
MTKAAKDSPSPPDASRLRQSRLDVSRTAVELIWDKGLARTSGEDIAAAAGISVRTLWRYFRSKEASVEPVLAQSVRWFTASLQRWPQTESIEDHLAADWERHPPSHQQIDDDLAAMKVITLARTTPELRTGWLIVCDEFEREIAPTVASRLGPGADELTVGLNSAAVIAAFRLVSEAVSAQVTAVPDGTRHTATQIPGRDVDAASLLARAIRLATPEPISNPLPYADDRSRSR